ncbi:SLAM family member 9-like [Paramisgurnus dabryanus]|uniref:SLAM family member 9-like n=1 Tax=Paramisgurnus dabryanus TaxID=90735 RepID=UPI0031F363A9
MWTLILFFITVEVAGDSDDMKVVKVMNGDLLRLHTEVEQLKESTQILWTFEDGKLSSRIAQYHGKLYSHYDGRFNGRVQLDQQTGALTISNISTNDSGIYKAMIVINKQISTRMYKVNVYAPVSVPAIKSTSLTSVQQPSNTSQKMEEFCSVLCSVKNDHNVSILWYKGSEMMNQTSSSDLRFNLSLSLKLHYNDTETYRCTAANPVSIKSVDLQMKDLCPYYKEESLSTHTDCQEYCGDVEVLIRLVLSVLVGFATVVFLVEHIRSAHGRTLSHTNDIFMRHQKV